MYPGNNIQVLWNCAFDIRALETELSIFKHSNVASHEDIVAAGENNGNQCATLKFFMQENGIPFLRAANPNYKDIPMTSNHRIIG